MCVFECNLVHALCYTVFAMSCCILGLCIVSIVQGKFFLICKFCFEKENKPTTVRSDPCQACSREWTDLLVHESGINNQLVTINNRRFTHFGAYYQLCYRQRFCEHRDTCVCAHSPIERDVWYLQRDHQYTWQQIVEEGSITHHEAPIQTVCSTAAFSSVAML